MIDNATLQYELAKDTAERHRDELNAVYAERNNCVVLIAKMALDIGLRVGLGLHADVEGEGWENDWRHIVFIDLPAGQVSWHMHDSELHKFAFLPVYGGVWDGHDTEEKYRRVLEPGL